MKRRKSRYWLLLLLSGLLVSCGEESEVLQAVEEEQEAILLKDYQAVVDAQRGKKPQRTNEQTQQVENYGEKGHDRRDIEFECYGIFNSEEPLARLYLVEHNEQTGDLTVGFIFGPYLEDAIIYAFEGRRVEILFYDREGEYIEEIECSEYHIGDYLSIPYNCYKDCQTIQILAGYPIPNGAALTFNDIQLFDLLSE